MNTDTIRNLQRKLGVTADGIWGIKSQAAFDKAISKPVVYATGNAPATASPFMIGMADYGIKEVDGTAGNAKILQYYVDTHNAWAKDDAVAWCAAFVGSCLERAGIVSTRSLAARSYLNWGKSTTAPKTGDIAVFSRGDNSVEGHVAFFVREDVSGIIVFGGNQSNAVNVGTMPKSQLLGYRTF